jgi:FKBP-type peptidyl-prolyl cis-trans isomerase FklB
MRKLLIAVASGVGVLLAVVAHSQNSPSQQPATVTQQRPGATPPAAAPGSLPTPPAAPGNSAIDLKQVSYAFGQQFAMNLKEFDFAPDMQSLFAGIQDEMTGAQPKFTDQQLGETMDRFMMDFQRRKQVKDQQLAVKNRKIEADFLARNRTQPGVQTTASGLQYKVIQAGQGPSPTINDIVRCNYSGRLIDGTEFDNSKYHGGPAEFRVGEVIPGWTEALQKMKVGDKWQLVIPAALAYDMNPPPRSPIEPGSTLIFDIELAGIVGQ